jgi:phosphatidyl-myo-inositol dimannoside synthase
MIVGDGDDRSRLEEKVKSLGLSQQIIFAGKIPDHEKVSHYCLADAYVMPSYGEGCLVSYFSKFLHAVFR